MKTGNDLVAEQVRYSTCFCYLPNCANQRNLLLYNELQFFCRIPLLVALIVFYRYTGLAFADVSTLKKEDLMQDNNGDWWIRKGRIKLMHRRKASSICNIPLLPVPLAILKKYENNPVCIKKGCCLPVPCNQKMNSYLKEIADFCGIKKNITTHAGRYYIFSFSLRINDLTY